MLDKPMDKITIKEIAQLSGVGISTVSRVVNGRPDVSEETRKRVLEVVRSLGYVPNGNAKMLKQKSTNHIAVIVHGMGNFFLTSIVERVQRHIELSGYTCLVSYIDEHDDEFNEAFRLYNEKKVLGIVFLGGSTINRRADIEAIPVPCVFTTTDAKQIGLSYVSSVRVDDRAAAKSAVAYLMEKGHRCIAVVGGQVEVENSIGLRYKGVLDCYEEKGLTFDSAHYIPSAFSFESAYEAVDAALKSGLTFTALFAFSDTMAIGAIKAIVANGKTVPGDISVIGFDGTELSRFYNPSITTVKQPREELARESVRLLTDGLERAAPGVHVLLETRIIEGGSVAALSQG